MSTHDQIVDLLIVGSGAVGLTLGAEWARLGRTGIVVDRQPRQYGLPRAGHIDHEVMRILQSLGAEQPTLEDAFLAESYTWVNAMGETLLSFPWGEEGISGWHSDYMQNSAILEQSLLECVQASRTVEHLPSWQAVDVVQHEDHVELVVERTRLEAGESVLQLTGEQRTLRGRYLVACDGANSQVREQLGIERDDMGFNEKWLVVDARIKRPFTAAFDSGQICDPKRPTTVLPLGKGHRRWEWHIRPDEDPNDFLRPERAWGLLGDLGVTQLDVEPVRQLVYTFEARIAREWRHDRVLLAGDAAHTMPPFMGQGMCSGMRDAKNLSWKLDLVLAGKVQDTLLDSYQDERDPHVRDWTVISLESGKIPCITDQFEAAERDEKFRAGYLPPMPQFPQLVSGVVHRDASGELVVPAGQLGLQARVERDGRVDLFDRLVPSTGFMVISTGDPRAILRPDQIADLQRLGTTFTQVLPRGGGIQPADGDLVDVDGSYSDYLRDRGIDIVINRPDFYVFGGSSDEGAESLADDLINQLSSHQQVPDRALKTPPLRVFATKGS